MSSQLRIQQAGEACGTVPSASQATGTVVCITLGGAGECLPGYRQVWLGALLPGQFSLLIPVLTLKSCSEVGWSYGLRLIPSQGSAAFGHVRCVGSSAWVWDVLPNPTLPMFQKNSSTLQVSAFRIFEVSPTTGRAFFDLAMTDMKTRCEASWEWSHLSVLCRWPLVIL